VRPRGRTAWYRRALLFALAVAGLLAVAAPAAAHLDLESSDPADGGVLKPSAAVVLTFTKSATLSGGGFSLFDARGARVPVTITGDGTTWQVRPNVALPPGRYGLTWRVVAGDTHPMTGVVRFGVAGAAKAPPGRATSTPSAAPVTTPEASAPGGPAGDDHSGMAGHGAGDDAALHAAMTGDTAASSGPWDALAALARWASLGGIVIAVGALVIVVTTLVGSDGDVRLSERVVRIAAAVAAAGALVEGLWLLATVGTGAPWQPVAAIGLRLVGAAGLALSLRLLPRGSGGRRSHDVAVLPDEPAPGGYGPVASASSGGRPVGALNTAVLPAPVLPAPVRVGRVRGIPSRPVTAGALSSLLLVSFLFDGHTAVVGPWPVVAAAALAHTAAAAVWVGGVVLLATLLLVRARAGVPTGAGELAVRFSIPATVAVVVAGVAGLALTALIVESPSDLVGTPWGRVLLVKLGLVAVVALMGWANNRYALPALDAWRPHTARLLRRTVAAEAAVMVAVLLATAVLVASGM
jgi:copper transport protein